MSKTKKLYIIILGMLAAVFTVLLCCPISAHANSAPSKWNGGISSGTILTGDCPLIVEHEELTFDVSEYPKNYYESVDDFLSYDGKVTAEYTFYNPEDHDVTATLMFPFGIKPEYAYIYGDYEYVSADIIAQKYDITNNGIAVNKKIRHSYNPYNFDTVAQLQIMSESYIEHEFYSPDMTVTKYIYSSKGIVPTQNTSPYAAFRVDMDKSKTRIVTEYNNGCETKNGCKYLGHFTNYYGTNTIYAIGEPLAAPLEWTIYENGSCKRTIPGEMTLVSTETLTLENFLLNGYDDPSISIVDYYNAGIAALDRTDYGFAYVGGIPDLSDTDLMRWYEYDITVPAKSRAINTVTAPMYPTINGGYKPSVYGYTYYLSPAENWASFGTLDITVNTPDYIVRGSHEFTRNDGCYTAHFDTLPNGELVFYLCAEDIEYPSHTGDIILTVVIIVIVLIAVCPVIGAIIVVTVYCIQNNKKKKKS